MSLTSKANGRNAKNLKIKIVNSFQSKKLNFHLGFKKKIQCHLSTISLLHFLCHKTFPVLTNLISLKTSSLKFTWQQNDTE